ncbi:Programmed cell death protein 2 [Perkinsus chesapeaki]|uniref:Programmed cell death protein 2 n=1 Tax=Perkinsus chesapeaki TaxID=330153 RepID=A0A7J6MT25_PERCH|nr:Programmed cell death protein 2 [Perkinsus chesapeaki]
MRVSFTPHVFIVMDLPPQQHVQFISMVKRRVKAARRRDRGVDTTVDEPIGPKADHSSEGLTGLEDLREKLAVLPTHAVFDLDDTVWEGDVEFCYGPPFKYQGGIVYSKGSPSLTLFKDIPVIMSWLVRHGVEIAYASKTAEPRWATQVLDLIHPIQDQPGLSLKRVSAGEGWGWQNKQKHMREIRATTGLSYEECVFFDNLYSNCDDVSKLGTTCGYCPQGMTITVFIDTMLKFSDKMTGSSAGNSFYSTITASTTEMSGESLAKIKAEETLRRKRYFQIMLGPLVVFTTVAVLMLKPSDSVTPPVVFYDCFLAPIDWFYWHPFLMLVGTVPIATSAVLIKKIGGYFNTKTHGFLLLITLSMVVGGLYVIYTNKEMHHKHHLQTWHSWIGVTAAAMLAGVACGGFLGLDPDCKIRTSLTTEAYLRMGHRYAGKVTLMLAYVACITGWILSPTMDVSSPCQESQSGGSSDSEDGGPSPLVGYIVKPRKDHLLQRRYFPSKIGGAPAWLDPELLPSDQLSCDSCAKPMTFLAQLYAPGETPASFHRTIYVFACPCCPGSFIALRSQLPRDNAYYPPVPASEDDTTVTDELVSSRSCSLCGLPRDVAECDGQGVHVACRRRLESRWKLKVNEFSLFIEECDEEMTESGSDVLATDLVGDEGHLLEEYEQKDEDELMDDSEVAAFDELCPEIDADDEAHREFEILAKANPGHVVYYCRGGEPVWMSSLGKAPATPTPCERCGAPREFEFQIQPQLVYKASCDFDFGVVAVYTCSADCEIKGYAKEFVAVQNEPEEWVKTAKQEVVDIPVSSSR